MKVQKTYTLVSADDRRCLAELGEAGNCMAPASFAIDVETIGVNGRRYMNKIAFCERHIPRKYRQWFGATYWFSNTNKWLQSLKEKIGESTVLGREC